MICLESIKKIYDKNVLALENINLEVKEEEFVALLGPSGCGKSTTLNIIAGLEDPTEGRVYFDNKDVTELAPKDRNIGMVFQSYALYPHLKVIDNIAFPLKQQGMSKEKRHAKAKEIAKLIKIEELLSRYPSKLSGGQQQRVGMARALVKNPKILLLDEPMSNLDARLKLEIREEIKLIQRETKVAAIIVTHDQEEAMAMADKIAILDNGRIQQFNTPGELYNNPQNLFVAKFMGSNPMNFIQVEINTEESEATLFNDNLKLKVPYRYSSKFEHEDYDKIVIGLRPHQLSLKKHANNFIDMRYIDFEDLGYEYMLLCDYKNERVRVLVSAVEFKNMKLSYGQILSFGFSDDICLFNSRTGENLLYE